jgi:hypothetical protein
VKYYDENRNKNIILLGDVETFISSNNNASYRSEGVGDEKRKFKRDCCIDCVSVGYVCWVQQRGQ